MGEGGHEPGAGEPQVKTGASTAVAGRYLPALDGLRAVAILGVMAYHLGYGWAAGGYLGVDLFFVLSGFLITGLLVEQWSPSGGIGLRSFWARRARRLLPGLLAMMVVLSVWIGLTKGGGLVDLGQLRGDALATLLYVANWHLMLAHQSYFSQFALPSPLAHTWSLAIEEQFYVVWPLVIVLLLGARRRRAVPPSPKMPVATDSWRRRGVAVTAGGALVSAGWMAFLAHHGAGVNRLYYGTDTRAFDLLAGAALAMLVAMRPQPALRGRWALHFGGVVGAAVLAVFWWKAGGAAGPPRWMFDGGLLLCAGAAAVVVADVRQDAAGPLGTLLRLRPLRWVGKISYGLYLWHWPVFVELTPARVGLGGQWLDAVRVAVSFALATASFYLLERPVRHSRLSLWPRPLRVALVPAGMAATAMLVLVSTLPAAAGAQAPPGQLASATSGASATSATSATSDTSAAAGTVPGAGGLGGQAPISLADGAPTTAHPMRVLLLGDSVMYMDGPAVSAALGATGVVQVTDEAVDGWSLSNDRNWRRDVSAAIAQVHPEVVIGMWSWDDTLALDEPARYRALLEDFVRTVLAPGDGVVGLVFQQFPDLYDAVSAVDPGQAAAEAKQRVAGVAAWNAIASSMPAAFPGRVMYLPVGAAVELHGRFTDWLPPVGDPSAPPAQWVRVRMVDNTHFCPAGAARYAGALLADMTGVFDLPTPTSTWSSGTWTTEARYRVNPAFSNPCPDDHPAGS